MGAPTTPVLPLVPEMSAAKKLVEPLLAVVEVKLAVLKPVAEISNVIGLSSVGALSPLPQVGQLIAFCCNRRRRASGRGNYVHLTANQFCDQVRDAIVLALRPTVFDRNIAAFYIARFAEALVKRAQSPAPLGGRLRTEEADHRRRRLLRTRRKRPNDRRAAEKRGQVFSSSDVACHVTLRLGVIHAMEA